MHWAVWLSLGLFGFLILIIIVALAVGIWYELVNGPRR